MLVVHWQQEYVNLKDAEDNVVNCLSYVIFPEHQCTCTTAALKYTDNLIIPALNYRVQQGKRHQLFNIFLRSLVNVYTKEKKEREISSRKHDNDKHC